MVYHPPDGESHFRPTQRGPFYHVQFLGPLVERAWVYPSNMIPFKGKKKFDEYVQEKNKNPRDKLERAKFDSKSTSCNRSIWVQSWKEAETAMNLPLDKRVEKFGRISVNTKFRQLSDAEKEEMLKLMSSVPLTIEEEAESLATFLREEMETRLHKHPELDSVALEEELRTQWPALDIPTKRNYLQNKLGIFKTSQPERPLRRGRLSLEQSPKSTIKKPSDDTHGSSGKPSKKKVNEGTGEPTERSREVDIEIYRLIVSPAQYRLQPVCPSCEVYSNAPGQMLKCQGPCGRPVHPSCMRYKTPPPADNSQSDKFRCPECLSGDYLCAICGKPDTAGSLFICRIPECGRHFHQACVVQWPGVLTRQSGSETKTSRSSAFQLLQCPAHSCQTCCLESEDPSQLSAHKDLPLLQCVRCPAAFHTGDLCTPAGSAEVSLSHIVCPRHYEEQLNNLSGFKTQHTNWCFNCFNPVTEKVLCQTCPATYHRDCLSTPPPPEGGAFTCDSCRRGLFPRYAQIIWAKIPSFRWWPCEIIHARNAPINILNMSHPEGTFPVHFLGSDEYQWVCRGAVFPYEIGLKTSAAKDSHGTKSVEKAFTRALQRAPLAHQLYVNHVLKRGLPLKSMHADPLPEEDLLPPASMEVDIVVHPNLDEEHRAVAMAGVTHIASNIFPDDLWSSIRKAIEHRIPSASCGCADGPDASSLHCSKETNCLHVINRADCTPEFCSFGSIDCGNRRLSRWATLSESDRVTVFRTINRGFGLKANLAFETGELVTQYVGDVIRLEEANKRIVDALGPSALANLSSSRKGFQPLAETHLIRLGTDLNFVIDANQNGNLSRFVNHSCEPNLTAESWVYDGSPCVGFFAIRPISVNDELTIDYLASQLLTTGLMGASCLCLCGTDSCVSTLHLPNSFQPTLVPATETIASSTRRRSKQKPEETNGDASIGKDTPKKISVKAELEPASVADRLAAGAIRSPRRTDRALIQPAKAVARAAAAKRKQSPTSVASDVTHDQHALLGLRPPPHEDFCYRCGDGGELLLCDKTTCPKSFHLNCLGLTSPPSGIWYCPWHYCDRCGHPSTYLCWRCPNSYCEQHADGDKIQVDELDAERWAIAKTGLNPVNTPAIVSSFRWICSDHVGMNIQGPGHRPQLVGVSKNNGVDAGRVTKEHVNAGHDKPENEQPAQSHVNANGVTSSVGSQHRVEPLKVTLKRKLKAEMAANQQAPASANIAVANSSAPPTDGARKRSAAASPAVEKKRPRLGRDSVSK